MFLSFFPIALGIDVSPFYTEGLGLTGYLNVFISSIVMTHLAPFTPRPQIYFTLISLIRHNFYFPPRRLRLSRRIKTITSRYNVYMRVRAPSSHEDAGGGMQLAVFSFVTWTLSFLFLRLSHFGTGMSVPGV